MQYSSLHPTIMCGPPRARRHLGSVPPYNFPSALPAMQGKQYGKLLVVSAVVFRRGPRGRPHLLTRCIICGTESLKHSDSLIRQTAGCLPCGQPRRAPKWLVSRASNAKDRCTNPRNRSFGDYGGRGIEFRFESPLAMAVWVQENLGLRPDLQLDRIDNDRHYEPVNLRYVTALRISGTPAGKNETPRVGHLERRSLTSLQVRRLVGLKLLNFGLRRERRAAWAGRSNPRQGSRQRQQTRPGERVSAMSYRIGLNPYYEDITPWEEIR
jgi:hypothetical protein